MLPIWIAGIILLLMLIMLFNGIRMKELENEKELLQSYMYTAEKFYQGIQCRIDASGRYRHDLAKHIQTLEELLRNHGEQGEVKTYMEGLKDKYKEVKEQKFCRDEIVDTVLRIKNTQCEEEKIPVEIHVEDCFYKGVEEADMVGLLCNLLDNAIEANQRCREGERRGIWFYMKKKNGKILIKINNCISQEEEFSFITQKDHKKEHGIGSRIIYSLVGKYHGTRNIEADKRVNIVTDQICLFEKEQIWT